MLRHFYEFAIYDLFAYPIGELSKQNILLIAVTFSERDFVKVRYRR
jgi:hypothetical protein